MSDENKEDLINSNEVTIKTLEQNTSPEPSLVEVVEIIDNPTNDDQINDIPNMDYQSIKNDKKNHKEKSNKIGFKVIALCLVVAILASSVSSYMTVYFINNMNKTVIYEGTQPPVDDSNIIQTSTTNVVNQVADSVVEIQTEQVTNSIWASQYVTQGAGSGVIISSDGYIVTNNHVIDQASTINVILNDGTQLEAELIATDPVTDIAIIKVNAKNLKCAILGDSDNLVVGSEVIAIGNPLGELGGSVTDGIISALDREIVLGGKTMSLLQTNAAINPGNSGGGLFNSNGELVGIVVAKQAGSDIEGLGFVIPINLVKEVSKQLIENGYVAGRPSLGVRIYDIQTQEEAMQLGLNQLGVYVVEVIENSAAQAAGIMAGDLFVSIDDIIVESFESMSTTLSSYKVGDTINITLNRDGKLVNVQVVLQETTNQ